MSKYGSFSEFHGADPTRTITEASVREFIAGKAGEDEAFRKALLADPLGTVEAEVGIKMPGGLSLVVHEDSNDELHLVLPAPMQLTASQLATVSGGWPTPSGCTADDALYDADGGQDQD